MSKSEHLSLYTANPFWFIPCIPTSDQTGAYRYDGEHGVRLSVFEQDVDEGDDLQRFAQPHAVSQDTAESIAAAETLQRLHHVVVQEADSTNLRKRRKKVLKGKMK